MHALELCWTTPREWAERALASPLELLADHAHCELGAAAAAHGLITRLPGNRQLVDRLAALAAEEFRVVELRWIGQYCSAAFLARRLAKVAGPPGAALPRAVERITGRPFEPYVPSGSLLAVLAKR